MTRRLQRAFALGIAFSADGDAVYGQIKGIRDIFSGLVLLSLLWMRMRRATARVFSASCCFAERITQLKEQARNRVAPS